MPYALGVSSFAAASLVAQAEKIGAGVTDRAVTPIAAHETVRFKVDHGVGIVFPLSARGKQASAEGPFEKIGADDTEGRDAAAEQNATSDGAASGVAYQVKATGAVIR